MADILSNAEESDDDIKLFFLSQMLCRTMNTIVYVEVLEATIESLENKIMSSSFGTFISKESICGWW